MYAIIETGGKQYRVQEGDIITVEKLGIEDGKKVEFDKVLAGLIDSLPYGFGNFLRFSHRHSNVALPVSDNDENAEFEAFSSLDDLADSVYRDNALAEFDSLDVIRFPGIHPRHPS